MKETFSHGDTVIVVKQTKYKTVPVGAIGIVRGVYDGSISVKFADIHNPRSGYDCFYLNANQLEIYNGGDIAMEGNYNIATIKFLDGDKTYRYALYDNDIGLGDICVVKSAHHGFGIARIVDIGPKTDEKLIREVVCRCDFSEYEYREETRKRKAELKKKMQERAAQLQELALYKMMAAEDPDMAELMHEFDGLEAC